jgi:hypothetical protein
MLNHTTNSNNKLGRAIEIAMNISIMIVALIGAAVLVKNYLLRSPLPDVKQSTINSSAPQTGQATANTTPRTGPAEGTQLSLAGVNWSESNENVVLALSNKCHFCSESAPFYQRLATELAQRKGARLIAVFPQETDEAKQYLTGLGLQIPDVRKASLGQIGVNGTPTLLIVDGSGKVKQSWMGRLTPERESEVLNRIKAYSET